MNSAEVLERLDSLIRSDGFSIQQELSPETRLVELDGWDSLKHFEFLLLVEDEFDFELSPEEIETVETLGELVVVVEKH